MRCSLRRYFEPVVSIHEAIQFQSAFALASERYMPHIVVEGGTYLFQSAFALASERCCLYRQFNRIADVSIRVRSRERTIVNSLPNTLRRMFQSAFALASERSKFTCESNIVSMFQSAFALASERLWAMLLEERNPNVSIRVRSRERTIH